MKAESYQKLIRRDERIRKTVGITGFFGFFELFPLIRFIVLRSPKSGGFVRIVVILSVYSAQSAGNSCQNHITKYGLQSSVKPKKGKVCALALPFSEVLVLL